MNTKVKLALIAIIPSILSALMGYFQATRASDLHRVKEELIKNKISLGYSKNPNFKELLYPNYGLSLQVPTYWTMEDAPAVLAGGEFNLVSRYEDSKGAIGINFRLRPIQPNYIDDAKTQIKNQLDVIKKIDSLATVESQSISGQLSTLFKYRMTSEHRLGAVRLYWVRLTPNVQLQIQSFEYEDAKSINDFNRDVDNVVSSITIAFDTWQSRYQDSFLN